MITGKNKERFENWYNEKLIFQYIKLSISLRGFYNLTFEMQQGVYLAYYDSLGNDCEAYNCYDNMKSCWTYDILENQIEIFNGNIAVPTRNEALIEAFKQADKLENEKH